MSAPNALEVAQAFIKAMIRLDAEAIIALLDDDVVLEFPYALFAGEDRPGARRQTGAAVARGIRQSFANTAHVRFENVVWRTAGDGVAIFQADGDCILSNGKPYRNSYLFIFEAYRGKIVRWWEYLNPVVSARATGLALESIP